MRDVYDIEAAVDELDDDTDLVGLDEDEFPAIEVLDDGASGDRVPEQ